MTTIPHDNEQDQPAAGQHYTAPGFRRFTPTTAADGTALPEIVEPVKPGDRDRIIEILAQVIARLAVKQPDKQA